MKNNSVGIIGCGWLGKALTKKLISQQYSVVVSTQHQEKMDELSQLGAQVECFSSSDIAPTKEDFKLTLFKQSCLIIAMPPGIRRGKTDYPEKIKHIVQLAEAGSVKQLIIISSTAVYNGLTGNVEETALLDFTSEKTVIIHQGEQQARKFSGNTIVLRLSGLVGPERHPGKFLRSGRLLSDPEATTNLIHQTDAVGLLFGLINKTDHTAIYNGSSSTHVPKRAYYEKAADAIGLPKPTFKEIETHQESSIEKNSTVLNKIINSNKIRETLGYTFEYDNLLAWLNE